jgi:hypothetical protein
MEENRDEAIETKDQNHVSDVPLSACSPTSLGVYADERARRVAAQSPQHAQRSHRTLRTDHSTHQTPRLAPAPVARAYLTRNVLVV